MTTRFEMPLTAHQGGSVVVTDVVRPFHVRRFGANRSRRDGHYGSIEVARRNALAGDIIFIDYAPGCGYLVERVGG